MHKRRVHPSTTSNNLSVSPQSSAPPSIKPSPSLPSFARSSSPAGLSNFFSRPTKWFSRTTSASRPSPTEPRPSMSSISSTSRRRPTISGPTDPRPIETTATIPGVGGQVGMNGLASLSDRASRSVLDLSRTSADFDTTADTSGLGDLRSISKKAWSKSADNLASSPQPKLSPLNTTLESRIEQYRTGTPGTTPVSSTQKGYPFPTLPIAPSTPPNGVPSVHQLRHAHSSSGPSVTLVPMAASPSSRLAPPSPSQHGPPRKRSFDVERVKEKTNTSGSNAASRNPFPFPFNSGSGSNKAQSPSASTPTVVEPAEPVVEDSKRASQVVHRTGFINRLQNFSVTSPQLSSNKYWKPYKMVLKGSKLYFYKPPSDRSVAIKELFPVGLVALQEEEEEEEDTVKIGHSGHERDDSKKKRTFWGRKTHPELVLVNGVVEKGSMEALVHETVFGTSFSSCTVSVNNESSGNLWMLFASSVLLCLPVLVGRNKFEFEFIRCASYLVNGAEEAQQDAMRERITWLASRYMLSHGSPGDEGGWETFCKDTLPAFDKSNVLLSTPKPSKIQVNFLEASPDLGTFSPRPLQKKVPAILNAVRSQIPTRSPARSMTSSSLKSSSSRARVWQALEQEGFTREVFLRMDADAIVQSLLLHNRIILESSHVTADVLLDSASTSRLTSFFGSDNSPNWLTRAIIVQILGPGHVSRSRDGPTRSFSNDGRSSVDGRSSHQGPGTHVRSEVISKWAKIGEMCRQWGDESSWRAIKAALCSKPIARLEKAWKRVDSTALSAVRTWVYASPMGDYVTVHEPAVTPWGGEARQKALNIFAKSDNQQAVWQCKPMDEARQIYRDIFQSFVACDKTPLHQRISGDDDVKRLTQLWEEYSSKSQTKMTKLDQFMSLSFAAEPRRKGLFAPHYWSRQCPPQYVLTPLLFLEPLPSITLIDRSQLAPSKKATESGGDIHNTRWLELKRTIDPSGDVKDKAGAKALRQKSKLDLRGLVLPVFDGELLLLVASGPDAASRPASTIDGDAVPETPPSRSPSMRLKSAAAGLDRKSSNRTRRSSLPSLSQRSPRLMSDSSGDSALRAVVQAGTLDALVHYLIHGLDGVTVSVADDNGQMSLSDKTMKSVRIDHVEFTSIWWNVFRSFVSPYVLFQLLRKEYMNQPVSRSSISEDDLSFAYNSKVAVHRTIREWLHNGGGAQDALDDVELHAAMHAFLTQPTDSMPESRPEEVRKLCKELERERKSLLQLFLAETMRPHSRNVPVRGSLPGSASQKFGVNTPQVDNVSAKDLVNNIDAMAAAAFRNLVQEDLFVTADILEVQTVDRSAWYPSREPITSSDELEIQTMYTFLMEVEPASLISGLSGDSLYRLLPPGLRTLIRAFNILRKWAVCLIASPGLGLPTRQARMELFLEAIEICRLCNDYDSQLDYGENPVEQPCVRSFVEAVLTSALMSPESRQFTRTWQNIGISRNSNAESMASLLQCRILERTPTDITRLTVDPAWLIERLVEVISLPDVVESSLETSLNLVNFDKRRQISNIIAGSSHFASRGSWQRRELDRCDFERLNKIEAEFAESPLDMRLIREDAQREAFSFREGPSTSTPSSKRIVRPFYRIIVLQQEKYKRDRYLRDRLLKEKKQEQQRLERKEDDFNRAMDSRNQPASGHKQHRSKRSMSALFSLMRPISTAFSLDSTTPASKRSPSELDFNTATNKPAFVLSLVDARVAVFINNERSYTFQLDTEDGGHYLLQATARNDLNRWISTINAAVRVHAQRRLTYLGNSGQLQFTDHNQPRPTTASRDPKAVFGVDLEYLVIREAHGGDVSADAVPRVLGLCLSEIESRGLTEQGIYRVGGATSEVNALREALNNGQNHIEKMTDIHSVCGVVKYWFRVLPEAVIPEYMFDAVVDAAKLPDLDERLSKIRETVHKLPRSHFAVLKRFAEHLDKVVDYEDQNHMTPDNLATVICPNILRPRGNDFGVLMKNMGSIIVLFKALITHVNFIFGEDEVEEEEHNECDDANGLPIPEEVEEDEFNVPLTSSPEPDEALQDAIMLASPA